MSSDLNTVGHRRIGHGPLAVPASSLVVLVTAALGAVAFFAWKPGVARSMLASPRAERKSPDGRVRLNRLRGNKGNQNYPAPTSVGQQRPLTVLAWCRTLAVPIPMATIR